MRSCGIDRLGLLVHWNLKRKYALIHFCRRRGPLRVLLITFTSFHLSIRLNLRGSALGLSAWSEHRSTLARSYRLQRISTYYPFCDMNPRQTTLAYKYRYPIDSLTSIILIDLREIFLWGNVAIATVTFEALRYGSGLHRASQRVELACGAQPSASASATSTDEPPPKVSGTARPSCLDNRG